MEYFYKEQGKGGGMDAFLRKNFEMCKKLYMTHYIGTHLKPKLVNSLKRDLTYVYNSICS